MHKRTHTKEKLYECDVCKKRFSQTSSLTKHKRTHSREKNLAEHKGTHRAEKPYECDLCQKRFFVKCHLKEDTHWGEIL